MITNVLVKALQLLLYVYLVLWLYFVTTNGIDALASSSHLNLIFLAKISTIFYGEVPKIPIILLEKLTTLEVKCVKF